MLAHATKKDAKGTAAPPRVVATARELFEHAECCPNNHFYVRYYRCAVGVFLGAVTKDQELVERSLDLGALEIAFRSEAAQRVGPIAAAIHQLYMSRGNVVKAAELLTRALYAIDNPDECWWLLLQAATSGTREHVARGLFILENYKNDFLLCRAHRLLFHARAAEFDDRHETTISLANAAADVFSTLHWRYHHAIALEIAERYAEAKRVFEELGVPGRSYPNKLAHTVEGELLTPPRTRNCQARRERSHQSRSGPSTQDGRTHCEVPSQGSVR